MLEETPVRMEKKMAQLSKVIEYLMSHLEERIMIIEYLHKKGTSDVDTLLDQSCQKLESAAREIEESFSKAPEGISNQYKKDYQNMVDGYHSFKRKQIHKYHVVQRAIEELKQQVIQISANVKPQIERYTQFFESEINTNHDDDIQKSKQLEERHKQKIMIHDKEAEQKYQKYEEESKIAEEHLIIDYRRKIASISVFNKLNTKTKVKAIEWLHAKKNEIIELKEALEHNKSEIKKLIKQNSSYLSSIKGKVDNLIRQIKIEKKKVDHKLVDIESSFVIEDCSELQTKKKDQSVTFRTAENQIRFVLEKQVRDQNEIVEQWKQDNYVDYDSIFQKITDEHKKEENELDLSLKKLEKEIMDRLKQLQQKLDEMSRVKIDDSEIDKQKEQHKKIIEKEKNDYVDSVESENRSYSRDSSLLQNRLEILNSVNKQIESSKITKDHLKRELEHLREIGAVKEEKINIMNDPHFASQYYAIDDQLNSNLESMQDETDSEIQDTKSDLNTAYKKLSAKYDSELQVSLKSVEKEFETDEISKMVKEYEQEIKKLEEEYDSLQAHLIVDGIDVDELFEKRQTMLKEMDNVRTACIADFQKEYDSIDQEVVQSEEKSTESVLEEMKKENQNLLQQYDQEIQSLQTRLNLMKDKNFAVDDSGDEIVNSLKSELENLKTQSDEQISVANKNLEKVLNDLKILNDMEQNPIIEHTESEDHLLDDAIKTINYNTEKAMREIEINFDQAKFNINKETYLKTQELNNQMNAISFQMKMDENAFLNTHDENEGSGENTIAGELSLQVDSNQEVKAKRDALQNELNSLKDQLKERKTMIETLNSNADIISKLQSNLMEKETEFVSYAAQLEEIKIAIANLQKEDDAPKRPKSMMDKTRNRSSPKIVIPKF